MRVYVGFASSGTADVLAQKLGDGRERFASLGLFTVRTTPEKVLEQIRSESPQVAKGLKAKGVEPEGAKAAKAAFGAGFVLEGPT